MFSVHPAPEKFENATITVHFGSMSEENWLREIKSVIIYIVTSSLSKSSVLKMFSVHTKTQSRRFKFLWFEDRFRDGLVRFQISPACRRDLSDGILEDLFFKAANEQEIILKNLN